MVAMLIGVAVGFWGVIVDSEPTLHWGVFITVVAFVLKLVHSLVNVGINS